MSDETTPAAAPAAPETPAVAEPVNLEAPAPETTAAETAPPDPAPEKSAEDEAAETARKKKRAEDNYWRRQAERERRERDKLVERLLADQQRVPQQQAAPNPIDYQDWDTYQQAVIDHKISKQVVPQLRDELRREAETARQEETKRAFVAGLEQAKGRYADFGEVAGSVLNDDTFPVSPAMAQAVVTSDKGPDLLYWIGSHPDEAARISRLDPYSATREMFRIEAALQSQPAVKRTATQAPPPPTTVKGGGERPVKNLADMTMEEYVAARKAGRRT